MSEGAVFLVLMCAMFPAVIIVAVVVKVLEVRKASRWPSTTGRVIANGVRAKVNQPGEPGYDFSDTEVTNEPRVEYEYQVGSRTYRNGRITIGARTSGNELEAILARYPVGTSVTVYYDPDDPQKAVLERDLPWTTVTLGIGCLLLFFIGGPLVAALVYFDGVEWLRSHTANPKRAPFVAAAGGFGLLVLLFALSLMRYTCQAARWPVTRGRIVASGVDAYRSRQMDYPGGHRTYFKPSVLYTYEVNGRQFTGDRVTLFVHMAATFPGMARRLAARYPVGKEVDVYHNPKNPGEAALRVRSWVHMFPLAVAAGMLTLAWAIATGRLD